jgi:uncharacterized membrane protein HdeD (DUF308 family)
MEYVDNKLRSMFRTSIIVSLVLILVGIFLIIYPETTLSFLSYGSGIILLITGLIPTINFFINKENQKYLDISFIFGIIFIIVGMVIIINPKIVASIVPLLIGIWMIINGVIKLYYSILINKTIKSISSIIISLLILVCGLLLVLNPFGGAVTLTIIIGIFLVVYSLLDLAECTIIYVSNKKSKKEDTVKEAKYIEKE